MTGVSFTTIDQHLSISTNIYTPTAHRTNRDNDYFLQSAPGNSTDYSNAALQALQMSDPNIIVNTALNNGISPSSLQYKKEKNGLRDIFDASLNYKWNTKFGIFNTGFYYTNNDNYKLHLGEIIIGVNFPFLKALNPNFTSYYRFTSEGGGGGNGTSNHRLSIDRTFFKDKAFTFTTSLVAGYQIHNNMTDHISGVSDISTKLQVNYGGFYCNIWDMFRPDSRLWDNPSGSLGVYKDHNRNDGKVDDPSKIHGSQNLTVVNQISTAVDSRRASDPTGGYASDLTKLSLIQNYQQQNFLKHQYFFTIGYSLKF